MNPEFQRNLWINLSAGRVIGMVVILSLFIFAASLVPDFNGSVNAVGGTAEVLFVLIVVFWGTWLASRAVVGEIRDRTWDGQRLSAIAPWSMVWGKLLGSTIFVWFGGAVCLAVIVWTTLPSGLDVAIETAVFYVTIGVFAQAISMLTSLLAVRRRSRHARLGMFFYQAAGLLAAAAAASVWPRYWLEALNLEIPWYGLSVPAPQFFLISILVFILWAIIGNHRLMRQELQFRNSPLVWIGFLGFVAVYVAGFVDVFSGPILEMSEGDEALAATLEANTLLFRLAWAFGAVGVITYVMLFLDDKDVVTLRWVGGRLSRGDLLGGLSRVPSWGWGVFFLGGLLMALVALGRPFTLPFDLSPEDLEELRQSLEASGSDALREASRSLTGEGYEWRPFLIATFGFLLRDTAIVLLMNSGQRARRGDFTAFVILIVLYFIAPIIINGVGLSAIGPFFTASSSFLGSQWLAPVPPLATAAVLWVALIVTLGSVRSPAPQPAASTA